MALGWSLDLLLGSYTKGEQIFKRDCQLSVYVLNEKILVLVDLELR